MNEGIFWMEQERCWFPKYDHAPEKCLQFVKHGLPAVDLVAKLCLRRRWCVQAGGHAGFWPLALSKLFDHVITFEPEPLLFQCMRLNCRAPNVTMYSEGLGAEAGVVNFREHVSAGSWRVDPAGTHQITLRTVDGLELKHCDAILLDVEGYETEVLEGARATIERCHPVILCELLPRARVAIALWLQGAGYGQFTRFGRDGIYTFGGKVT